MNYRNLEALMWVARLGGVGAAARNMNISQPAVTRRIRELEAEIGAPVLVRHSGGVQLTPIGRSCVASAEKIAEEFGALKVRVSGDRITGRLRFGVGEVVALTWLQEFMRRLEMTFPGILLELDVDLSAGLVRKLDQGDVDLAIVPGPVPIGGVVRYWVWRSHLCWMGSPRYDLGHVTPDSIADQRIITLSPDANVNIVMEDWFDSAKVRPSLVNYCNSLAVIAYLVRSGMGISLLPEEIFGADADVGRLLRYRSYPPIPTVDYWLAYPRTGNAALMSSIAEIAEAVAAGRAVGS